jgi:hypothetical protein
LHSIPSANDDRTAEEILTLVQTIPTVAQWRKSLERNEALIQLHAHDAADAGSIKKEKVMSCAEGRCTSDATHFCTECGHLCDDCQKKAHSTPAGSSHMCISFVEQKRKKQLALESAAAQCISGYGPFIAEVAAYEAKLADHATFAAKAWTGEADHPRWSIACVVSRLCTSLMHVLRLSRLVLCVSCADELTRLQVEGIQKARMLQVVTEWNRQHEAQVKKAQNAFAVLEQTRAHEIQQQQSKRAEAERIKHLPIQAILAMPIADIQRAFDVSDVKTARGNFEAKCRIPAAPRTIHPAVTFMNQLDAPLLQQQLNAPTILSSLTPELKQQLQKFLGAVKLDVSCMTHHHC